MNNSRPPVLNAKTIEKIGALHRVHGISVRDLCERFNCSEATISKALSLSAPKVGAA